METLILQVLGNEVLFRDVIINDSVLKSKTEYTTLLRLKWILDVHNLILRSTQDQTLGISGDVIIRVLLHIIALGSSGKPLDQKDCLKYRRIALEATLSAFCALVLSGRRIQFDEIPLVETRLDELQDAWDYRSSLSEIELSILNDVLKNSIEIQRELHTQWSNSSLDLVALSAGVSNSGRASTPKLDYDVQSFWAFFTLVTDTAISKLMSDGVNERQSTPDDALSVLQALLNLRLNDLEESASLWATFFCESLAIFTDAIPWISVSHSNLYSLCTPIDFGILLDEISN
jgi:hypothetical protein